MSRDFFRILKESKSKEKRFQARVEHSKLLLSQNRWEVKSLAKKKKLFLVKKKTRVENENKILSKSNLLVRLRLMNVIKGRTTKSSRVLEKVSGNFCLVILKGLLVYVNYENSVWKGKEELFKNFFWVSEKLFVGRDKFKVRNTKVKLFQVKEKSVEVQVEGNRKRLFDFKEYE